jgi:hypothetical protein
LGEGGVVLDQGQGLAAELGEAALQVADIDGNIVDHHGGSGCTGGCRVRRRAPQVGIRGAVACALRLAAILG